MIITNVFIYGPLDIVSLNFLLNICQMEKVIQYSCKLIEFTAIICNPLASSSIHVKNSAKKILHPTPPSYCSYAIVWVHHWEAQVKLISGFI